MSVGEPLTDLHADQTCFLDGDQAAPLAHVLQDGLQVGAIHHFHHNEEGVVAATNVEHLHAVGVSQVGAETRLIQEHAHEFLLACQVRKDALDGYLLLEPLQPGALGSKNFGHAPRRDALNDTVSLLLCRHYSIAEPPRLGAKVNQHRRLSGSTMTSGVAFEKTLSGQE